MRNFCEFEIKSFFKIFQQLCPQLTFSVSTSVSFTSSYFEINERICQADENEF